MTMEDLCKQMSSNAMMRAVYTDEIRNDPIMEYSEMQMNKTLFTLVRVLELYLNDY